MKKRKNTYDRLKEFADEIVRFYVEEEKSTVEIAEIYSCDKSHIRYVLQKNNIKLRNPKNSGVKYHLKEDFFDEIDTPNKAYVLGILYADGTIDYERHRIKLTLQDLDIELLKDIKKVLEFDKPLYKYERRKKNPKHHDAYEMSIYSLHMCEKLIKWGCVPNKSLILQWPTFLREDLYSHFIRGYFDGDGGVREKCRGASSNFTSSRDFCMGLSNYLTNLGIENKLDDVETNELTKRVNIYKKEETRKLGKFMYKDADLYMKRKYKFFKERFKDDFK